MIAIRCSGLTKYYGIDLILENISFQLNQGEKVGLIGKNGAGKSTLFNILTGKLEYEEGRVHIPPTLSMGHLLQETSFEANHSIWDHCLPIFAELIEIENTLRNMESQISATTDHDSPSFTKLLDRYHNTVDQFESQDGYSYRSHIKGVLNGLGFKEEDFTRPVSALSGGQKSRLNIAKLLLKKPDILFLDEPTNHLDISSVLWLETFLRQYAGTVIVITHDRFFLDKVTNKIIEIENHGILEHQGNYSDFVKFKADYFEQKQREFNNQQTMIKEQEALIRKFKQHGTEKLAKRAKSREKRLDKVDVVDKPISIDESMALRFEVQTQSGKDVLFANDLSKSFDGNQIFENNSFDIYRNERIGLIGPNGIGKTTLFKLLLDVLIPDSGNIKYGHNVKLGYFEQHQSFIDEDQDLVEEISDACPKLTTTEIRTYLGSFLFKNDDVFKKLNLLSGGEKARVSLLKLLLADHNFLLLDEPTNHLDISSKEALEGALTQYDGTLLMISHDRYFLDKVCTKILDMSAEGMRQYLGNYSYYLEKTAEEETLNQNTDDDKAKTKTQIKEDRKREKELQKEIKVQKQRVKQLEGDIQRLETELEELEALMCQEDIYSNPERSQEIHLKTEEIKLLLTQLYTEWEQFME